MMTIYVALAFGLVVLEAMAAGLPCIATATPGAREALGDAGKVVAIGSPSELAAAIEELRGDADERARLGAAARAAVADRTFARVAERLVGVYHACRRD